MVEEAIKDYTQYLKADTKPEVSAVEETIDNMLMRLEEYKGTLEIMKSERTDIETSLKSVLAMRSEISNLTYRIDAMETFISRVHQDMNTLESQLIEAEQDYPDKSGNALKTFLKPIFSKISPELAPENTSTGGMSSATMSSFEKVDVINTDELFKKTNENK